MKLGTLTAGTVETTIGSFVASDNVFPYMSSVRRTLAYWKQLFYDILATLNN